MEGMQEFISNYVDIYVNNGSIQATSIFGKRCKCQCYNRYSASHKKDVGKL